LSITGAMESTPTAAMEVLLGIPPLHLYVEAEVKQTMCRLNLVFGRNILCGSGERYKKTRELMDPILREVGRMDTMVPRLCFERNYECIIPDRTGEGSGEHGRGSEGEIVLYTDGSQGEDSAGAGVYLPAQGLELREPLGGGVTALQAEVFGIIRATCVAQERIGRGTSVTICSDSQEAIRCLESPLVKSKLVMEARERLNILGQSNDVRITWVPGHVGGEGNELADYLARKATHTPFIGHKYALGCQLEVVKLKVKGELTSRHIDSWAEVDGCRQSKMFLKGPDPKRAKWLLGLSRKELKQIVQVVTGHCNLNYHLKRIKLSDTPTCQKCYEEDETAEHFLCECPTYSSVRERVLGAEHLDAEDLFEINLKSILGFVKATKRLEVEEER